MKLELNLYRPPLYQPPQPWRLSWLAAALVLTLIAIALHAASLVGENRQLQVRLSEEERARVELERSLAETRRLIPTDEARKRHQQEVAALRQRLEARQRFLIQLGQRRDQPPPSPAELLEQIAAARPSLALWLMESEFTCCQEGMRPHVFLRGLIRDDKTLTPYLHALAQQPLLRGLVFATTQVAPIAPPAASRPDAPPSFIQEGDREFTLSTRSPEPRLEARRQ